MPQLPARGEVMEPLTTGPDGRPVPGPHESWRELAEHSIEHDQLPREDPARVT
jgi:hypothetical protein